MTAIEDLATCAGADVERYDLSADEALQPGQLYDARSTVEREANAFAVALLMPREPFLAAYLDLRARDALAQGNATRLLARRFGVSEDATLRRLEWLLAPEENPAAEVAPTSSRHEEDADQRIAARLEAPALVIAGPGTGKTATLISRVSYLASERDVEPANTLVLTFSRKAAAELRERTRSALSARGALTAPYISTIHHFCLDLLGRFGQFVGLSSDVRIAPEIERYLVLRDVMRETPLAHLAPTYSPDLYVRDVLQAISRAKDDLITPEDALRKVESALPVDGEREVGARQDDAARQSEFALVFDRYQRQLSEQRMIDFGDVIAFTVNLLREHGDVAREVVAQWPHVLVDEYQDINRAMDTLLRELTAAGARLWAVGDADQAIYRFRGADPGIVYRFQESYPDAHVVSLVQNYRSRQGILDAASAFASQFSVVESRRSLAPARRDVRDGADCTPAVVMATAATDVDELAGLARRIAARHAAGVAYSDQVALLRTRRQVERVAAGLRERAIPTSTLINMSDAAQVKQVLAVVSLLSESAGLGLIRAARQEEHSFTRADAILMIRDGRTRKRSVYTLLTRQRTVMAEAISQEGRQAMRRLGRMLRRMRLAPSVATGIALYCFSFTGMGANALGAAEHREANTALRRLFDLARAYDSWRAEISQDSSTTADWNGFVEYLRAASVLHVDGLGSVEAMGDNAVRVMTVHASKGLEFPTVYAPQLANRRFPLTGGAPFAARLGQREEPDKSGELSEEAALFYVAMTRARDELVLSYARKYGKAPYTVSPFLRPIEVALGSALGREEWLGNEDTPLDQVEESDALDEEMRGGLAEFSFDLSELETYQRCPRQYAYRYVDSLWAPPSLGALYSGVLRQVSSEITISFGASRNGSVRPPQQSEALALFAERWRAALGRDSVDAAGAAQLADGRLRNFYQRQGQRAIEHLWLRLSRELATQEGAQSQSQVTRPRSLTVKVGSLTIRGEVETVQMSGETARSSTNRANELDGAVVVRYKSAGALPTLRDLFVEVAADSRESGVTKNAQGRTVAANLTTGDRAVITLSARQRVRLTREAERAATGILRRDFHATPDERLCQRCPFAASCPE
jgi:superfamily I DNA/RNA helicase